MLTGLFKNASFGPPPNLHKCISLVEVYRFGQRLGWRFSPRSTFPVSLASSRAFTDAPHSRFRCGDPNQCLPNFLEMQLLALPQIYTRLFNLFKSIDLDSAWVRDSRPYQLSLESSCAFTDAPQLRFRAGIPTNVYQTF